MEDDSYRKLIFDLLDKNPLLSTKHICQLLQIPYHERRKMVYDYRYQWKSLHKNGLGSKAHPRPTFHNARGWVYVKTLKLDREAALKVGWRMSRAKNRPLLWNDKLGRMEWFETGRVNLHVKAPALKGRVYQLFCNGFSMTNLIDSMVVLKQVLESIRLKSAHAVFDAGQRLPYMVIDLFKLSNGIIIKSGDATHPTAFEVHFCYPDWAEKNEQLLGNINRMLQGEPNGKVDDKSKRFYVS